MLIKPVQRITKYPLLFDDLLACTTPVHPDYFSIRSAAEMSRALAMEIDEAKRRKDVVANAISKKPSINSSSANDKGSANKKGLKIFRKDKGSRTALPSSSSSLDLSGPAEVPQASLAQLRDLRRKVDETESAVRRIGQEFVMWTAAAKEVLVIESQVVQDWLKVVQLEPTDTADKRMLDFRNLLDGMIAETWTVLVS